MGGLFRLLPGLFALSYDRVSAIIPFIRKSWHLPLINRKTFPFGAQENSLYMGRIFSLSFPVLPAAAMLMLLSACASTDLTAVWKDAQYKGHARKIMVIGILQSPVIQRQFEDDMVRRLKEHRTDAIAGYTVLPDRPENDRAAAEQKIRELGADAVMIVQVVDKKTVTNYVPSPGYYGSTWQGYYAYSPGTMVQNDYAVVQTYLYDLASRKPIWTASSETLLGDNAGSRVAAFVKVIVKSLADNNVIAPPQ